MHFLGEEVDCTMTGQLFSCAVFPLSPHYKYLTYAVLLLKVVLNPCVNKSNG